MTLSHLTDFPDRLSPMLIKELRQGLRTRGFTLIFLIFQGLLAFILLTAGTSVSSESAGTAVSGIIFSLFSVVVLVFQPMRGVSALSSEITSNTIEMMVLTRLSAARIVLGKWFAIVSQSALMLISIIPYLILRYFFGGMNLIGEMVFLALIFLTSMALTAVMVGLSGTAAKLMRVLPVLAFIFALQAVPSFLFRRGFGDFMDFCSLTDWPSRISIFLYVVFIAYYGWCALSQGISAIAPAAENHSTPRRVIALGLALIAAAAGFHSDVDPEIVVVAFGIILGPAVLVALTEPSVMLPPIYKPFLKRGPIGQLAAIFLLPGWPAGVFFTVLTTVIGVGSLVAIHFKKSTSFDEEMAICALAILGGILLPALGAAHFAKQESKRFTVFLLFLVVSMLVMAGPAILANINNHEKILWLFIWDPWVFLTMMDSRVFNHGDLLLAVCVVDLVIFALLIASACIVFRKYREVFLLTHDGLSANANPIHPLADS